MLGNNILPQVVQIGPCGDGMLESQGPRSTRHQLVLPEQRDAVHLLYVGHKVVV